MVSWRKISHLKRNFIRKSQSEKIWNLSNILFKLLSFLFLSRYKRDMTSRRVCFFLQITINSSLSSILLDFADILILRNIKNPSKPCFSSLQYFQFWCMFFLKTNFSNLIRKGETSDNKRKKLDESWTQLFYN